MRKVVPILGVVTVLLAGGGAWYLGVFSARPASANAAQESGACERASERASDHAFRYTVKDRVVNLADPGARRFLKASLVLEVPELPAQAAKRKAPPTPDEQKKFSDELNLTRGAEINDVLTTILSSKRADEVMTPEGRDQLREEIKSKVNSIMPKNQQIAKIFLTDFIIQ